MATSIRLDEETEKRLDRLVDRTGRTKSYYLREIIENGLEDIEDYYLAAAAVEEFRKGNQETITLEELDQELDLAR